MKLQLVSKTERLNVYCLRFIVPAGEARYTINPTSTQSNDRSIEFTIKKDGVFGDSTTESALADNLAWFTGLVVGELWDLQRALERSK